MESISRISRREKRNVEICFLVQEENENFSTQKTSNLQLSPISRREREILKSNLMMREEIETSRFQTFCDEKEKSTIQISVFFFCPKNAKSNLRHKRSFDAQIQNKDCVFDNTITKVQ